MCHLQQLSSFYRVSLATFSLLFFGVCFINYENPFVPKVPSRTAGSFLVNQQRPWNNKYLQVKFNLASAGAVCQADDTLLIYVLSTVTNFQRRKAIRFSWGSRLEGTCLIFIVGLLKEDSADRKRFAEERRAHEDILQIDHAESYANVVYKEVAILQWSHHFYRHIPYLFKTDDDLIVDSLLLSSIARFLLTGHRNSTPYITRHRPSLLSKLTTANRSHIFCGGWPMRGQPVVRGEGKFAVRSAVWPNDTLPPYCSGFGWFMSAAIRDRLVNASLAYPLNQTAWIGDVFVSGFLARAAQVECSELAIDYEQTLEGRCACLMMKNPMLTVCSTTFHGGFDSDNEEFYSEFGRGWAVISQRHKFQPFTLLKTENC